MPAIARGGDRQGVARCHSSPLSGPARENSCDGALVRERVRLATPLYEDATFMSFRCADPDGYAVEVYWEELP